MTSADEEMITNLFKMLQAEMNERRSLFSDYGGDYASYYRNSGTVIPNIVVVLNDFSGFAEQYEDFQDDFTVLSRDGVKYGIYLRSAQPAQMQSGTVPSRISELL